MRPGLSPNCKVFGNSSATLHKIASRDLAVQRMQIPFLTPSFVSMLGFHRSQSSRLIRTKQNTLLFGFLFYGVDG